MASGQRYCDNCGKPVVAVSEPSAAVDEGERRHATVVFSDLSGYTALNERLDPEDVERIVARIRREAVAVVEAHGGVVNQFVGDEVMALFGIPHAGRDDARFEAARDLAREDAEKFQAWFEIAAVNRYLADVEAALRALDAADVVLERWGGEREHSRVAHLRGNLHFAAGRGVECKEQHMRALAHAHAAADPLCQAHALSGLGDAAYAIGDMTAASEAFTSCVEICEREGFPRPICSSPAQFDCFVCQLTVGV